MNEIEPAITRLVREAPVRDAETLRVLAAALADVGTPLALSIARILEYLADDLVDPGVALPALAEACATLVAGERDGLDARSLEAARYRIDTLEPRPDRPPAIAVPDVPASELTRVRRPRT
ncbi:MAG TPA: hypothetical protein VGG74_17015 [Kofleriaceae bacterium]